MKTYLAIFILCAGLAKAATLDPFELPDMNNEGKIYSTKTQTNAIYVIEAYFLDCPYCNENAPNVNALASRYADYPRVQVLDLGADKNDEAYVEWISRHSPNHPVLKDGKKTVLKQLGTTGYPSVYIVDSKGTVVYENAGVWGSEEEETINSVIDGLLRK